MFNHTGDDNSHWVSFTDLVMGFMVVFIVISLKLKNNPDKTAPEQTKVSNEAAHVPTALEGRYLECVENFRKIVNESGWPAIQIADSATIRFATRTSSQKPLFLEGSNEPTDYFYHILFSFIPKYIEELDRLNKKQDSIVIKEIRIEGHTDSRNDYLYNLELSSKRALTIQTILLKHPVWSKYPLAFKKFVEQNTIACGYSFSRTLDENGIRVDESKLKEDFSKSRRVEFRILLDYKNKKSNENS